MFIVNKKWQRAVLRLSGQLLFITCFAVPTAWAQGVVTGHYQPLFGSGLKSGVMTSREGFVYQNGSMFYHTTDFRDADGNPTAGQKEINVWGMRNALVWLPGRQLFGADYGTAAIVPVANLDPNPVFIEGEPREAGVGVGDLAIAPLMLGWHSNAWHSQFGYIFFAPTGRFKLGASDNVGKGFWTHMPYLGVSWMPAQDRPWHVSLMTRYEYHSKQKDRDLKPGDTLTFEFGVGRKISQAVELGLVAHRYQQLSDASGSDAGNTPHYGSYGVGAEVQFPLLGRFPSKARLGRDFGAKNLSEGPWLMLEFNFPL